MRSLVDQRLELAGLVILNGIEQRQPSQFDGGGVRQELPRFLLWRVDPHLPELARSLSQQRPDSLAHWLGTPTWESRSCVSASCSALITASRSPFKT